MINQILATWTSSDGQLIFDFLEAEASNITVAIRTKKQVFGESQQLMLQGDGSHLKFNLNLTKISSVTGTLYLRNIGDVAGMRCAWGAFSYSDAIHKNQDFEGCMVELPPSTQPPQPAPTPDPPHPLPPEPSPIPTPIIPNTISDDDLFPYVYLRYWPHLSPHTLAFCFIQYHALLESPPAETFITQLEALHHSDAADARDAMEVLSLSYLEGLPPFQGLYLSDIHKLGTPMERFPLVVDYVLTNPALTKEQLTEALPSLLNMALPALLDYLHSSEFLQSLQQAWASYFALIIILGYEHRNLVQLTQLLGGAHLLQQCYVTDNKLPTPITPESLQQLANAPVLLPATLFPLPTSPQTHSPPLSPPRGWIEPYAIGDLQMLRQRFLRYQAGDIAHIENVMAGERRKILHKKANRQLELQEESTLQSTTESTTTARHEEKHLDELRRTVTESTITDDYQGLKTSYGPPTQATTNGTVTHATTGQKPGCRDRTSLARKVLDKSINHINRSVGALRSNSILNETEEARESVFDNSTSSTNCIGLYRWLNRIYQAYVVNYGVRLMLEFIVEDPAAHFLKQLRAQLGLDLEKPLTLAQQGIEKYTDVDRENSTRLAAYYGVEDITPPPSQYKVVSASLRSGEEISLTIPTGYQVYAVKLEGLSPLQHDQQAVVLVGGQAMTAPSTLQGLNLFGEENNLSAIANDTLISLSPPSGDNVVLSIRVTCQLTPDALRSWQIKSYNVLAEGYKKRAERFCLQTEVWRNKFQQPASVIRGIERESLKRDCVALLLARHTETTGNQPTPYSQSTTQPSQFLINEPRYLQFFDEVLEWSEISYKFYAGRAEDNPARSTYVGEPIKSEPLFSDFLEAGMARVLIPARPGKTMELIYYLSSGQAWFGTGRFVAVNPADAALVHELQLAEAAPHTPHQLVDEPWEVVVPTTMQVLDETGTDNLWQPVGEEQDV
ncbi:MAG: hypothetical protein L3J28_10785 [Candidatus Polarisedimenticolaceae bacterium]|nr:hypothetical protein [Candidatus Polarisedimenticolaceae bacterium]